MIEGNRVNLDGEELSLSAAALKVLTQLGYKTPTASGSEYWMFEGELLDERRRRIEAEQFDEKAPSRHRTIVGGVNYIGATPERACDPEGGAPGNTDSIPDMNCSMEETVSWPQFH